MPHTRTLDDHQCDTRPCFNPEHLRWGTRQENVDDRVARSNNIGRLNGMSRLSPANVLAIREAKQAGLTNAAVADLVGTSAATVSNVYRGLRWAHIQQGESSCL